MQELEVHANNIRRNIVSMVTEAKSGHPGGSLSATDIVTYLFFKEMRIDPKNPKWADRDRFVLSKGHASPVLYATLAERGFFPESELAGFRKIDRILQGHPEMKHVPGVDMSTGSLGQGLSAAVGMALAGKLDQKDFRVFALVGDGESEEGQIWEASMAAAHYKLDNLTAFLDHNHLQIDGPVAQVMNPEPLTDKWRAFGWHVIEINGHCFEAIEAALEEAKRTKGKPTMIVAETVKGKGVSFMENQCGWHGKAPSADECAQAVNELCACRQ